MKRIFFSLSLFFTTILFAQVTPTPDKLWGKLFEDVQLKKALGDNKSFVDMVPQYKPEIILKKYAALKSKDSASLRQFVLDNFYLPATPGVAFTQAPKNPVTRNSDFQ